MKIKFKLGGVRVSYEYNFKDNFLKNNPFLPAFIRQNPSMGFFTNLLKNTKPENMNNPLEMSKSFQNFMSEQRKAVNTTNPPEKLMATGHDIYNYISRYGNGNCQIQAVMKVDGKLDFSILSKVVRLSIDAEPVFGCRFIESETPYWSRLDNIDAIEFCSIEETNNVEEAVEQFIQTPLDIEKDSMLKLKLIRSQENDILCLKICHACCDATGAKEYIGLLSQIYSHIFSGDINFVPSVNTRSRLDQDKLFDELGIKNPDTFFNPGAEVTKATWPFPWKKNQSGESRAKIYRFTAEQLESVSNYAKAQGASNDSPGCIIIFIDSHPEKFRIPSVLCSGR